MRAWLILLAGLTAGCASSPELPDPSTELRDYEPEEVSNAAGVVPLPDVQVETIEAGTELQQTVNALDRENSIRFVQYLEAAEANAETLEALIEVVGHLLDENRYLLATGRAAERQSEIFLQLYAGEVQSCRFVRLGAYGAAGLSFLFLGAAAL